MENKSITLCFCWCKIFGAESSRSLLLASDYQLVAHESVDICFSSPSSWFYNNVFSETGLTSFSLLQKQSAFGFPSSFTHLCCPSLSMDQANSFENQLCFSFPQRGICMSDLRNVKCFTRMKIWVRNFTPKTRKLQPISFHDKFA